MQHSLAGINLPRLPTPGEGNCWSGVAGEHIQPLVDLLRAIDVLIELRRHVGWGVHQGSARVDNRVEARHRCLPVDQRARAADLPETRIRRDVVVFDLPGIERFVHPTEVQLSAFGRELEAELALGNGALINSSPHERVLVDC